MSEKRPSAPMLTRINLLREPVCLRRGALSVSYLSGCCEVGVRVMIAERYTDTLEHRYVCDTGYLVAPDGPVTVPTDGLIPGHRYYLQMTVWDAGGLESEPCAPFAFVSDTAWADTTGIWAASATGEVPDFAFLRCEFSLTEEDMSSLQGACLSVTATSPEPARQYVYNVSLNGHEVGVGPCRLGKAPDGQVFLPYASYDVTKLLRPGANVLAAVCYTTAEHAFLCQLTAYDRDGNGRILTNSGRDHDRWLTMDGDAVYGKDNSIGTVYFKAHACNIQAPLYPFGYTESGFLPDGRWTRPALTGDVGMGRPLIPDETEPVRRYPATSSVTVTNTPDGTVLIDLGAEIIGGLRLTLYNPTDAPVSITLDYAEQCIPDGQGSLTVKSPMNTSNCYRETWLLTPGRQTLETLSLMAYRYVRVVGLPVPLAAADVCGLELRKPFSPHDSTLTTDRPLLADIYALMKHTVRVTSQDIYVDSQSRERGAYEGDLLINMLAAYATEASYAPARLSTEYLLGHRTWPADYLLCIIFAARADYMATGDDRLLRAWYDTLRSNLFTDCMGPCGLIRSPEVGASNRNAVLVDWPPSERDGYDMGAPYNTVLNALSVRAYEDMAAIAAAVGRPEDAAAFRVLHDNLYETMLERLYDPDTGLFRDGLAEDGTPSPHASQHATAYALNAGLYRDRAMANRMAEAMCAGGKLRVSVYAAFFLLEGLYRAGRGDLANRLLLDGDTSDGARTWAYMLYRMGATVTTEAWNETNKPNMTLSHPWGAAPAHMLYRGICGISPVAPGCRIVDIRPCFDGIDSLDTTLPTIRGPIALSWHAEPDGTHTLSVALPVGMGGLLTLPGSGRTVRLTDGVVTVSGL